MAASPRGLESTGALRLMAPVFTLNEVRRTIDNPTARWFELIDTKRSNGLWSDANIGHRLRLWTCIVYFLQDYNRPITDVPYFYDDFGFEAFTKKSQTVVPTHFHWSAVGQCHWRDGRPDRHHARFVSSCDPHRQSGFLPDGFISHHCDQGNDAAMKAYGFEWLQSSCKCQNSSAAHLGRPTLARNVCHACIVPHITLQHDLLQGSYRLVIRWPRILRQHALSLPGSQVCACMSRTAPVR